MQAQILIYMLLCKDVLDLIEYVKKTVYKKFNVMLQEEVVILGGK